MNTRNTSLKYFLVVSSLLAPGMAMTANYPEFDDALLKQGRSIWLGTCAACHANTLSDAPQAKNPAAWQPRIAKGKDVLLNSALNGFSSDLADMPPRGGNADLSDAEVNAALEYMLKIVSISTGEKS
jgi:cytochrome c5